MKRILIAGLGRSGTTIALNALYRHPSIYAIPVETKFLVEEDGFADLITAFTDRFSIAGGPVAFKRFNHMMRHHATGLEQSKFTGQHTLPNAIFEQYDTALDEFIRVVNGRRYFDRPEALLAATRRFVARTFDAETAKAGKTVWTEKTPSNIWRLPFLRSLWPDCHIVHAMRDPRGVLLSLMRRNWMPQDIVPALKLFEGYLQALLRVRAAHADDPRFHEIRLEDLEADTGATLARLAAGLGIEPFAPPAIAELRATIADYYASKPPGGFDYAPGDLALLEEWLMPAIIELGYPPAWARRA